MKNKEFIIILCLTILFNLYAKKPKSVEQIKGSYFQGEYSSVIADVKTRKRDKKTPKSNILNYYKGLAQYSLAATTKSKIQKRKLWREAVVTLESVIKDSSNYVEAIVKVAEVYQLLNKPSLAEKHYSSLFTLRKKNQANTKAISNNHNTNKGINISIINPDTLVVSQEESTSFLDIIISLVKEKIILITLAVLVVLILLFIVFLFILRKKFKKKVSENIEDVSDKDIVKIDKQEKAQNKEIDLPIEESKVEEELSYPEDKILDPPVEQEEVVVDDNIRDRIFELYDDDYSNIEIAEKLSVSLDEVAFVVHSIGGEDKADKRDEKEYINEKAGGVLDESDEFAFRKKVKELALNGKSKEDISIELNKPISDIEEILNMEDQIDDIGEDEVIIEEDDQLKDIIRLANEGKTVKEIAFELEIGIDEVEFAATLNNLTISEISKADESVDKEEVVQDEAEETKDSIQNQEQEENVNDTSNEEIETPIVLEEAIQVHNDSVEEKNHKEIEKDFEEQVVLEKKEDIEVEETISPFQKETIKNKESFSKEENVEELINQVKFLKKQGMSSQECALKLNYPLKDVNYIYKLFPVSIDKENNIIEPSSKEAETVLEEKQQVIPRDESQEIIESNNLDSKDEIDDNSELADLKKEQVISYIVAGYTRKQIEEKTKISNDEIEFIAAINSLKFSEDLKLFNLKLNKDKDSDDNLDTIIQGYEENKKLDRNLKLISYDEELTSQDEIQSSIKKDKADYFTQSAIGSTSQIFAFKNEAFESKDDENLDIEDKKDNDLFSNEDVNLEELPQDTKNEQIKELSKNEIHAKDSENTNSNILGQIDTFIKDMEELSKDDDHVNDNSDDTDLNMMKKAYQLLDEGLSDEEIAQLLKIDIEDVLIYKKIKKE